MPRYLGFVLHAPLAAFGGVAVGERRTGWDRPGRSAVIGLIAAALGVDRTDEAAQLALDRGYGLAIRTDAAGRMLADYHTVQVPAARRGRHLPTRAAELAVRPLETMLTRREYRTDALHLVVLWALPAAPHPLEAVAAALRAPAYTLFLGRKSCPLGLPLAPDVFDAEDPVRALVAREDAAREPERWVRRLLRARAGIVSMDADAAGGLDVARLEWRRDRIASRARWQFDLRGEAVLRDAGAVSP